MENLSNQFFTGSQNLRLTLSGKNVSVEVIQPVLAASIEVIEVLEELHNRNRRIINCVNCNMIIWSCEKIPWHWILVFDNLFSIREKVISRVFAINPKYIIYNVIYIIYIIFCDCVDSLIDLLTFILNPKS